MSIDSIIDFRKKSKDTVLFGRLIKTSFEDFNKIDTDAKTAWGDSEQPLLGCRKTPVTYQWGLNAAIGDV